MARDSFDALIVALGFACVAMLETEAHSLLGLSVWRANLLCDDLIEPELARWRAVASQRLKVRT